MNRALLYIVTLVALFGLTGAGKVFKWIDKDGNVHYGDSVPPEYADQVFGKGEVDDEDLEKARQEEQDRILLKTYLSVEDIERVRDRRIDQLKARQEVTSRHLGNLNERLVELEKLAEESSVDPETGENVGTPDDVLFDIQQTQDSIKVYEDRMARNENEQRTIQEKFASDISRFRALKGLPDEPPAEEEEPVATESTVSESR
ncbi:MAG: DUF4124 domain-containing protein [Gammaproteobacteria bacterium]|jgi:hypothetical protein